MEAIKGITISDIIKIFTLLSMVFCGIMVFETRYTLADDFEKYKKEDVETLSDFRKSLIIDQIIEIESIPEEERTDWQKAQLIKLKLRLENGQ